jgi:putative selenium metabolism hydrolase
MKNNDIFEISKALDEKFIDFCKRLIETRSLSGEEDAVADLVEAEMKELGYDEIFRDEWGNVTGCVFGNEPGPTIMYNGHMDVVTEGERSEWEGYDPYQAVIDVLSMPGRSGEEESVEVMHGRGASDMKGGLAAQIYAGGVIAEMKRRGARIKGTFLMAAAVLEENGEMMGTIRLAEKTLPSKGIEVDAMVCAEPSGLDLKLGHRGRMEILVTVQGRSCHGSSPWLGINAVEKAAKFITAVERSFASRDDEDPLLGKPGIALTIIECSPAALCIVPDRCTILYDRRLIPGETTAGALEEIRGIIAALHEEDEDFVARAEINKNTRHTYTGLSEEIESSKEVWRIDREHPFIRACGEGLADVGQEARYGYWPFSTDIPQIGSVMKKPCVGYGPGQEVFIHNGIEKIRLDYLRNSLHGFVSVFLRASELPKETFRA